MLAPTLLVFSHLFSLAHICTSHTSLPWSLGCPIIVFD